MARSFANTTDDISAGTRAIPATGSLLTWWYPTFASTDGLAHVVFDCRNNGSNIFGIVKFSDNRLYAGWYTAAVDYRVIVNSGSYTLNQNAWNSLVLTWDDTANETKVYLNGSQAGSTVASLVTFVSSATRWVGNESGTATRSAGGRLAEFAILSRALSAGEVTAFHRGRLPNEFGFADQYLPLWGNDSPEPDLSGNGNSGTVTGAVKANHSPTVPHARRWWGSVQDQADTGEVITGPLVGAGHLLDGGPLVRGRLVA